MDPTQREKLDMKDQVGSNHRSSSSSSRESNRIIVPYRGWETWTANVDSTQLQTLSLLQQQQQDITAIQ